MRVLLDECVPRKIGRLLAGHDVRTVTQQGWSGKRNGELLSLMAESGFEVLVTVDRNIVHQQNLGAAGVALIVMVAIPCKFATLAPLIPRVLGALTSIQPGDSLEVRV